MEIVPILCPRHVTPAKQTQIKRKWVSIGYGTPASCINAKQPWKRINMVYYMYLYIILRGMSYNAKLQSRHFSSLTHCLSIDIIRQMDIISSIIILPSFFSLEKNPRQSCQSRQHICLSSQLFQSLSGIILTAVPYLTLFRSYTVTNVLNLI